MVSKQTAEKVVDIITTELHSGHMTEEMFLRGITLQDFIDCMAIIRAHFAPELPDAIADDLRRRGLMGRGDV